MDYQSALEFLKSYYEQTWNNLLWLLGISFGVIGILMPMFLQWLQSRNNKKQLQEIKELSETLMNSKMNELNKKFTILEKNIFFVQGCTYITQGNLLMKTEIGENTASIVLHSFLYAAYCFLEADRKDSLPFVIKTLTDIVYSPDFPKKVLPISNGNDLREVFDITIALFNKNNENGKYITIIQILKDKIKFFD